MKKIIAMMMALMLALSACSMAEGMTEFFTRDMNGNEVTEEIFAPYDLTMMTVWATWCGYCVDKMPELVKVKESLPENANLITLCEDAAFEPELAKEILDVSGANFTTMIATNDIYNDFMYSVRAFPSTYFLDSEGNVVGEPIVGVPSMTNTAEAYYEIFMERLAQLEG